MSFFGYTADIACTMLVAYVLLWFWLAFGAVIVCICYVGGFGCADFACMSCLGVWCFGVEVFSLYVLIVYVLLGLI